MKTLICVPQWQTLRAPTSQTYCAQVKTQGYDKREKQYCHYFIYINNTTKYTYIFPYLMHNPKHPFSPPPPQNNMLPQIPKVTYIEQRA